MTCTGVLDCTEICCLNQCFVCFGADIIIDVLVRSIERNMMRAPANVKQYDNDYRKKYNVIFFVDIKCFC